MRTWRTGLKTAATFAAAATAVALSGAPAWAAAPANDIYSGAVVIETLPADIDLNTAEATAGPNDAKINAECGAAATDASVWYKYTATEDGFLLADVSGSDYSAGVAVIVGTPDSFTFEGCANGALVWEATEGVTYVLLVFDDQPDATDGGSMNLVVDETTNPALRDNDFTGDGTADVVARDSYGRLYVYPGNGLGGWKPRIVYGTGWNAFTAMLAPGDFDGDGGADLMVRDSTGRLYLYPGDGAAGWYPRVTYGTGWNAMTAIVAVGDFDGDWAMDLLARDGTTGRLYLYPGDGEGGWLPRVAYGTGWNAMTAIVGIGDFNGDDTNDVVARDAYGKLWLYPGDGAGGWLARVGYGTGWNAMTALTAPGDFNGDGNADLMARDSLGRLWLYPGNGSGGWLARVQIGTGWNIMTAIVS